MGILLSKPDEQCNVDKNEAPTRRAPRKRKRKRQRGEMDVEEKCRKKNVKSSLPRTPSPRSLLKMSSIVDENGVILDETSIKGVGKLNDSNFVISEPTKKRSRRNRKRRQRKPHSEYPNDSLTILPNPSAASEIFTGSAMEGKDLNTPIEITTEITTPKAARRTRKTSTSPYFSTSTPQLPSPSPTPIPSIYDKSLHKESKISIIETMTMPSSLPHFRPTSPHEFGLIQEKLRHEPWKMLVAVIFLNVTTAKMALPLLSQLLERWPTPEVLSQGTKLIKCN